MTVKKTILTCFILNFIILNLFFLTYTKHKVIEQIKVSFYKQIIETQKFLYCFVE